MTKDEAIKAMKKGLKVTNSLFLENEYIYMEGGKIVTSSGDKVTPWLFWIGLRGNCSDGWDVYNIPCPVCSTPNNARPDSGEIPVKEWELKQFFAAEGIKNGTYTYWRNTYMVDLCRVELTSDTVGRLLEFTKSRKLKFHFWSEKNEIITIIISKDNRPCNCWESIEHVVRQFKL